MPHPDFERYNRLSDEEKTLEAAICLMRCLGPRVLSKFSEGFPEVCGPPGLRALVAPDGVTVCVLAGGESPDDVVALVMSDVAARYVRPAAREMIASGASPDEVEVAATQILLERKGQYAIELLGDPPPARRP